MRRIIYTGLPFLVFVVFAYAPNLFVYFDLKFAPYTGAVYAVQLEDNSFVYGKIRSNSLN